MSDKTIISIISKTYFTIISLFSFIFLSLITIFIILQHGLFLENLSFPNITIKKVYIKWNDKLNISIEEIDIKKVAKTDKKINLKDIQRYLKLSSDFFLLSESIVIEKIKYDNITLKIKQNYKEQSLLSIESPNFNLQTNFKFYKKILLLNIQKLTLQNKKVAIDGNATIDIDNKKIYSKLHLLIDKNTNLTLYLITDKDRVDYAIKSKKKIEHIQRLISLFHLPKEIKFWAQDAIDAPSVTLQKFQGYFYYNDMATAYKNINIKAIVNRLNYTYNTKLDAIHTQTTELKFKKGVLYIYPKEAYSYNMYLDKSWLKIDFTKPQEILTLHLLFNGMLNKDMLHILNTYKINLPFLQNSGKVQTNLKISVNLRTIQIDAQGDFFTKKANFDYLGLNIDIADTKVKLNNYDVSIPTMKATYKEVATANVMVHYNAKKEYGKIVLALSKIQLDKSKYLNNKRKKPLKVIYKISPKGDTVSVAKSEWIINGLNTKLNAITMPFNLKKLDITIPTCYFSVENIADGFITGTANIKDYTLKLKVDLLNFNYQGIKVTQSNSEIDLTYDKKLFLKSLHNIFFSVNGSPYNVDKLSLTIDKNKILLGETALSISKYIRTNIKAKYNLKEKNAAINLNNFTLIDPKNKKILYYKNRVKVSLQTRKKEIYIGSKALHANFKINNKRWILHLNSIATIAKNSNFLKKYNLNNGKITFYKQSSDRYTKFRGEIDYKYKLLTDQNRSIKHYSFNGYVTKSQNIYINVNKKVAVKIADNIKINLLDYGINTEELLKFVNLIIKHNSKKSSQNSPINIFFKAKNSYLYVGNNRYVISDSMSLQYFHGMLTAQLLYGKGKAGFRLQGDKFHLYGNGFNDKFMEKLFSLSKFDGGSLDFSMQGSFQDYEGLFYMKDTTIQDYVVLNNILAFINTIPALATFSLPGYNTKGLYVNNAYMKFHSKNHIFTISDIYVGSKEIKIVGKGTASVKYNDIDLTLNLKTDLGSNFSKIPIVGYIIFDGESISTTLKITGKLTNPKVETMLARDIVVAPLNIILRTITLPYKIIKDIADINSSKK